MNAKLTMKCRPETLLLLLTLACDRSAEVSEENRDALIEESETRLENMQRRAATLEEEAQDASADTRARVHDALLGISEQRSDITHDIAALRNAQGEKYQQIKQQLLHELSELQDRVERASSYE